MVVKKTGEREEERVGVNERERERKGRKEGEKEIQSSRLEWLYKMNIKCLPNLL